LDRLAGPKGGGRVARRAGSLGRGLLERQLGDLVLWGLSMESLAAIPSGVTCNEGTPPTRGDATDQIDSPCRVQTCWRRA
jgi:hypothetical protein